MESIDVSKLRTNNCRDFSRMFAGCETLKSIDVSDFLVGSSDWYPPMNDMFNGCTALQSLKLSGWDTGNVVNMQALFQDCSSLTSLDVSHFNTSNTLIFNDMFSGCSSLEELDVSHFDNQTCIDMIAMFGGCSKVKELDLANFGYYLPYGPLQATSVNYLFYGCSALERIYVSKEWICQYSDLDNGQGTMFVGCESIVGETGTTYDSSNVDFGMANAEGGYFTYKGVNVTI